MNTKEIGECAEAAILSLLLQSGKAVLRPFGDNQRYDLVVDNQDGTFSRIQVKSGSFDPNSGVINFSTSSSYRHRGRGSKSYKSDVEFLAVYCRSLDKGYLIPIADLPESGGTLRVWPSATGQIQESRFAGGYEIKREPVWTETDLMEMQAKSSEKISSQRRKPRPNSRRVNVHAKELLQSVTLIGYEATGRKYGVSGNAIKKRIQTAKKQGEIV